MPIITLTSDWGLKDHYLATIKGCIITQIPHAQIIDITHNITPFDIISASFVIRHAYSYYPKGTIHIIGVNTEATLENDHIVALYDGHYFIGTDNGIFSLLFDSPPEKIIELNIFQDSDFFTFPTRDVFIKCAAHIAQNKNLEELGTVKTTLFEKNLIEPVVINNVIKGNVIYIDRYENVFTNIHVNKFKEYVNKRSFNISFRSSGYEIRNISQSYGDVEPGEKLALFSTTNFLEIAINKGKASSLLGLTINDNVNIIIED